MAVNLINIVSKVIITAAHVVQTTDALHVEFSDGQRRSGRVLSSLPWVDLARAFRIPQELGLLIERVADHSPGSLAGRRGGNILATLDNTPVMIGGDIILSVNGITLSSEENIQQIIKSIINIKAGDKINLAVWRRGKRHLFIL